MGPIQAPKILQKIKNKLSKLIRSLDIKIDVFPCSILAVIGAMILTGHVTAALWALAGFTCINFIEHGLTNICQKEQVGFNDEIVEYIKQNSKFRKEDSETLTRTVIQSKAALVLLDEILKQLNMQLPDNKNLPEYVDELILQAIEESKNVIDYSKWINSVNTLEDLEKDLKNE